MATAPTKNTTLTGNMSIDGLVDSKQWDATSLTFSFPTSGSQYESTYGAPNEPDHGFETFNTMQRTAVYESLAQIESFTNLSFTEVSGGDGVLRWGVTDTIYDANTTSAWGHRPSNSNVDRRGDAWFNESPPNEIYNSPDMGNLSYVTIMHELGHQIGLQHPFGTGPVPEGEDNRNYTVMSYNKLSGGSVQSYMLSDISAFQHMYGADFNTNSGNTIYTFSPSTGAMSINGVSQGAPTVNKILRTIWDGNGNDTYDFSNYTSNLTVDLAPGGRTLLGNSQHITDALGDVVNANLYQGDTRSLIENAKGGSGNDVIKGNQAANVLEGGAGADTLTGGSGADTFVMRKETAIDLVTDATSVDKFDVTSWSLDAGELSITNDGTRYVITGDNTDEKFYSTNSVTASQFLGIGSGTTPTLSAVDVTGNEGDGKIEIRIALSAPATQMVTVNYATASGTAISGTDFLPASGQVIFSPGDTFTDLFVDLVDDSIVEPSENFTFTLTNPVGAAISDATGVATITDNDTSPPTGPTLSIQDATVTEGNNAVTIILSSGAVPEDTWINYHTVHGTAGSSDYTVVSSGQALINSPEDRVSLSIPTVNDGVTEGPETFSIVIDSAFRANSGQAVTVTDGTAVVTINDGGGDPAPTFSGENYTGTAADEQIVGNSLDNIIDGAEGNDVIHGGAGNDIIRGGLGTDELCGDAGADVFDFNNGSDTNNANGFDTICDFQDGIDIIDISNIDADKTITGNQTFTLMSGAFTAPGQLKSFYDSTTNQMVISGNTDADTKADFKIYVDGNHTLTAADFVL